MPEDLLAVSAACDVAGQAVADVLAARFPNMDRAAIAGVASCELFYAAQDVARLVGAEMSCTPNADGSCDCAACVSAGAVWGHGELSDEDVRRALEAYDAREISRRIVEGE